MSESPSIDSEATEESGEKPQGGHIGGKPKQEQPPENYSNDRYAKKRSLDFEVNQPLLMEASSDQTADQPSIHSESATSRGIELLIKATELTGGNPSKRPNTHTGAEITEPIPIPSYSNAGSRMSLQSFPTALSYDVMASHPMPQEVTIASNHAATHESLEATMRFSQVDIPLSEEFQKLALSVRATLIRTHCPVYENGIPDATFPIFPSQIITESAPFSMRISCDPNATEVIISLVDSKGKTIYDGLFHGGEKKVSISADKKDDLFLIENFGFQRTSNEIYESNLRELEQPPYGFVWMQVEVHFQNRCLIFISPPFWLFCKALRAEDMIALTETIRKTGKIVPRFEFIDKRRRNEVTDGGNKRPQRKTVNVQLPLKLICEDDTALGYLSDRMNMPKP